MYVCLSKTFLSGILLFFCTSQQFSQQYEYKIINIYQWSRAVCCWMGSVERRLSFWMRGGPRELIFDQMCFGCNSAAAFFFPFPFICIEIIWSEGIFRRQSSCEKLQLLLVCPGRSVHACVCWHGSWAACNWAPSCAATCGAYVKAALRVEERPELCHTHTVLTILSHWAQKGIIVITVNSPDNISLSIFRQYSSVKWTNTQRMRVLTGLMMPDWLS